MSTSTNSGADWIRRIIEANSRLYRITHTSTPAEIEAQLKEGHGSVVFDDVLDWIRQGWIGVTRHEEPPEFRLGSAEREMVAAAIEEDYFRSLSESPEARRALIRSGWKGTSHMTDEELREAFFGADLDDEHPDLAADIRPASQEEIDSINKLVFPEGWALFNDGDIERDDDRDVFQTDQDVIDFITRLAEAGSAVHRRALVIDSCSSRGRRSRNTKE